MDNPSYRKFLFFDVRDLAIAALAIVAFLIFIPIFTYVYFAQDLGSMEKIMNRKDTGLTLLDDQGKPFFTFYSAKSKSFVPLSQIPKITQEAVISSEDKGFYSHAGFSFDAIFRSLYSDVLHKDLAYGGSTITQQLVKNSLLYSSKSFLRKYQEVVLASELERRYTKDQILEMYLNSVYFGSGAFGVEEAAQTYFGKDASGLSLPESAMLAGLLPAPSTLSPLDNDPTGAITRQKIILGKMASQGYITSAQSDQAQKQKLSYASGNDNINSQAPHFALMVRDELIKKYGEEQVARSGFQVQTTINLNWQEYAQKAVLDQVNNLKKDNVSNGSAVVMDPKTGEIKALVGSVDWFNNQFGKVNVATSLRQPGSSFKPIVYSAALQDFIITPQTILQDSPTTFNNCPGATPEQLKDPRCSYKPLDYDRSFRGPVTVRRALSNSLNIPAVEVMSKVGVDGALNQARNLGISSLGNDPSQYGLSLVLGAGEVQLLELTDVYATFANSGKYNPPTDVLSIKDKYGTEVYHYNPPNNQVLDPGVAFLISSILSDNSARAEEFGNALTISRTAAVKTGTTENFRDAWTMGYTPSLAVGVWVGNNDGTLMDSVAGSLGPAPIWKNLMEHFLAGTKVEAFTPPSDVVAAIGCRVILSDNKPVATSSAQDYYLVGSRPSNCSSVASASAILSQEVSPIDTSSPSPGSDQGQGSDCTGPDGRHLKLSNDQCTAFNKAWKH